MEPGNIIVCIVLVIIVALAVWGTVKRIRHGSSCCGEHEVAPKKVRVSDTNKSHYLYNYDLSVDGMHCSNCARRVENGFNSRDGLWATADIGERKVGLRSKRKVSEDECRKIVSDAGYTLLSMKEM